MKLTATVRRTVCENSFKIITASSILPAAKVTVEEID